MWEITRLRAESACGGEIYEFTIPRKKTVWLFNKHISTNVIYLWANLSLIYK